MVNTLAKVILETDEQSKDDEPDHASLGLDPSLSAHRCPSCGAQCLDLGAETGDHYRLSRRWYRCINCNNNHSEIIIKI